MRSSLSLRRAYRAVAYVVDGGRTRRGVDPQIGGMAVFIHGRRTTATAMAILGALVCLLAVGAGSAWAENSEGSFLFGPRGSEAGEIGRASAVAIDQATGDVFVGDPSYYDNRLEQFNISGEFVSAWGSGVATGADELQTCTTSCLDGIEGSGIKEFCAPTGVAVDNELSSLSYGDVYMDNFCGQDIYKFDPNGKLLLVIGGHVNETTGGNVCVTGGACQGGTQGAGNGEFTKAGSLEGGYIAVGPEGRLYVGDKARVEVFEPSGAWRENISLSTLSSEGHVTALAVSTAAGSAGDVFVKVEGVPGVHEFDAAGVELPAKFDEASETVEGIALDAAGDLFVSESSGGPHLLEFSPFGEELESFGSGTLVSVTAATALDDSLEELLVYGTDIQKSSEYGHEGIWGFSLPAPGPLVEPLGAEKATGELRGHATLEGSLNPEGHETTYHFEYVDEAHFQATGYADASSTPPASTGSTFNDQTVSANVAGLVPGARYHWRLAASNSRGTVTGPDETVETTPAALVEGPWASSVTSSSVTFGANIDPLGADTSYRLEYGTSTAYGHVLSGNVGEGMGYVAVAYHLQELETNTTYHYRLVTSSEVGTIEGADHTFTTQLSGGALALPDGRAWELVSPADKGGALIENVELSQAAADGSGIAYAASEPIGEGISGHVGQNIQPGASATLLSERGPHGWETRDISPKGSFPPEGVDGAGMLDSAEAFHVFSPDLSQAAFELRADSTLLSAEATEPTLYMRNDKSETYSPLVTANNVPPGTKISNEVAENNMLFLAATPDLTHIIFTNSTALTPEAGTWNLYEWSDGQLHLVNVLPGGEPATGEIGLGGSGAEGSPLGAMTARAVSNDGRWIVYRQGNIASSHTYFVRDMVDERTISFGDVGDVRFETMSSDGSKVSISTLNPRRSGNLRKKVNCTCLIPQRVSTRISRPIIWMANTALAYRTP